MSLLPDSSVCEKNTAFFFNQSQKIGGSILDSPDVLMECSEVCVEEGHISFDKLSEFLDIHGFLFLLDSELLEYVACKLLGKTVHIAMGYFVSEFFCFEHKLGARIMISSHH